MKVAFAGTPDFAQPSLQALIDSEHDVVAVWTQPDRPAGRGKQLTASVIKQCALQHGIPVHQPVSLKSTDAQQMMADYQLDCLVVAAYGLLLPQVVLDMPRYGCINVHGSLLPRWRGAAPVQAAILAGDSETGVTIMQMAAGLDSGNMLLKRSIPITTETTAGQLMADLAGLGAEALIETLYDLPGLQAQAEVQDEGLVTYAHKISKAQAAIDWQLPAEQIDRVVRAYYPWPVAFCDMGGQCLRIWCGRAIARAADDKPGTILGLVAGELVVATGDGCYAISELQLPNKRRMSALDFSNAYQAVKQSGQVCLA